MLLIFGGRSTALEIAEVATALHPDWTIRYVIGDTEGAGPPDAIRDSALEALVAGNRTDFCFIVALSNQAIRARCLARAESLGLSPVTLVHPQAYVAPSARVAAGCFVAAGCRISSRATIGRHCILNYNVVCGHDTVLGEHVTVNPAAMIGGTARIGNRVLIGANAFIYQGVTIGEDCQIDALTYVRTPIPAGHLCTSRQMRMFKRADL